MLKNIRVRTKFLMILAVNIILYIVMGIMALMSANSIESNLEDIYNRDLSGITFLLEADRDLHQAYVAERTLLFADIDAEEQKGQLDSYNENKGQADTRVGKFAATTKNTEQLDLVKAYYRDMKLWSESSQKLLENKKSGMSLSDLTRISLTEDSKKFDAMRDHIDVLTQKLREQADGAFSGATKSYSSMFVSLSVITLISALIGALCIILVSNNITAPMKTQVDFARRLSRGEFPAQMQMNRKDEVGILSDSLDEMKNTLQNNIEQIESKSKEAEEKAQAAEKAMLKAEEATQQAERAKRDGMYHAADELEVIVAEISTASDELTQMIQESRDGSEIQRSRTAEAATAMEQMNSTVAEVAANSARAAENANSAREQALDGRQLVDKVIGSIELLNTESLHLQKEMGELGSQADAIGHIMAVISDIADQTNLLALNAAIEAARAGEAGRGFAVVADEVRKLAEKTMTATQEVGSAISTIQGSTGKSIKSMEKTSKMVTDSTDISRQAGTSLSQIQEFVDQTADQVQIIATAAEEQSATSEEINRGTEEINSIAVDTAEAMSKSLEAMENMARLSDKLRDLISELKK